MASYLVKHTDDFTFDFVTFNLPSDGIEHTMKVKFLHDMFVYYSVIYLQTPCQMCLLHGGQ